MIGLAENSRSGREPRLAPGSPFARGPQDASLLRSNPALDEPPVTQTAATRAQEALTSSPIYALRELRIERSGETLLLQGRVATFYQKQLAQEAVRAVAQGIQVENLIDVA